MAFGGLLSPYVAYCGLKRLKMTYAVHLCFKQAQPKMCHSPKVDDRVEIFNRPGVAGAVLQSPPSLINSLIQSVILKSKYLPNTLNPKPEELES